MYLRLLLTATLIFYVNGAPQFRLTQAEYDALKVALNGNVPSAIISADTLLSVVDEDPENFVVLNLAGTGDSAASSSQAPASESLTSAPASTVDNGEAVATSVPDAVPENIVTDSQLFESPVDIQSPAPAAGDEPQIIPVDEPVGVSLDQALLDVRDSIDQAAPVEAPVLNEIVDSSVIQSSDAAPAPLSARVSEPVNNAINEVPAPELQNVGSSGVPLEASGPPALTVLSAEPVGAPLQPSGPPASTGFSAEPVGVPLQSSGPPASISFSAEPVGVPLQSSAAPSSTAGTGPIVSSAPLNANTGSSAGVPLSSAGPSVGVPLSEATLSQVGNTEILQGAGGMVAISEVGAAPGGFGFIVQDELDFDEREPASLENLINIDALNLNGIEPQPFSLDDSIFSRAKRQTSNAKQIGSALASAGGLFGGAIGRFLDTSASAKVTLIDDLESLGLLVLDEVEATISEKTSRDSDKDDGTDNDLSILSDDTITLGSVPDETVSSTNVADDTITITDADLAELLNLNQR